MEQHENSYGGDAEGKKELPEGAELYGDSGIISMDAKIPKFLLLTYLILPLWGLASLYYFWNGSSGWFDRGYWKELQIAANTTFPIENQNTLPQNLEQGTDQNPLEVPQLH